MLKLFPYTLTLLHITSEGFTLGNDAGFGAETFLTALHDEKLFNYILLKRLSQGKNHKFWNLQKLFHKSFVWQGLCASPFPGEQITGGHRDPPLQ